jgi:hypothetical protein
MNITRRTMLASSAGFLTLPWIARAQAPDMVAGIPVNYDEAKVGSYTLPEPLVAQDGTAIRTAAQWAHKRRPELLRLFETQQFGVAPPAPRIAATETEPATLALGGKALRRQVRLALSADPGARPVDVVIYTPAHAKRPVPVLLAINFTTNAAAVADPELKPGMVWSLERHARVPWAGKGIAFPKIDPVPMLDAGIGFAAFYYGDVDPDDPQGFAAGIRARYMAPGQTQLRPDQWGTISAWGWGISRVIDHLETDRSIDPKRIAIHGVSRLGKTVMWAGARDTRVAATIASCSGEGGAALSHRNYGETVAHLVAPSRYPYQFAGNFAKMAGFPDVNPIDGNLLVALHAPKPLLLQTGTTDGWSDPKGEFLSAVDAGQVYRLLSASDLGTTTWPGAGQPILNDLGYYMHEGGHGTIPSDWPVYLAFLKRHLKPEA